MIPSKKLKCHARELGLAQKITDIPGPFVNLERFANAVEPRELRFEGRQCVGGPSLVGQDDADAATHAGKVASVCELGGGSPRPRP
jgi:hypothetical protein